MKYLFLFLFVVGLRVAGAEPVGPRPLFQAVRVVRIYPDFSIKIQRATTKTNKVVRKFVLDGVTTDTTGAPLTFNRPLDKANWAYLEASPRERKLAEGLLATPGIVAVFVKENKITVIRDLAFNWDEVEPSVISCIRATLFDYGLFIPPREPESLRVRVAKSPEGRDFHVNRLISGTELTVFGTIGCPADQLDKVGPKGVAAICAMMELPRVSSIFISPYCVSVRLIGDWTPALTEQAKAKLRRALLPHHPRPGPPREVGRASCSLILRQTQGQKYLV